MTFKPMRNMYSIVGSVVFATLLLSAQAARADQAPMPQTVVQGAKLVTEYDDDRFFEGPTWDPAGQKLYFTAFPRSGKQTQILRLDAPGKVTVWQDNTEGTNGTALSADGRLLGAQAYGHRVMSYNFADPSDKKAVYVDSGLNQPNDVCQSPRGDIYFTDPDWKNSKTSAVYRLNAAGKAEKVISDMPLPNGVKTSLDGRTLYIGDSGLLLWKSFPIRADGSLGPGKVFFDAPTENKKGPDGMALDDDGNLYLCGRGGVWVVTPAGKSLGLIEIPEFCSNATFGGADCRTLYLTCDKKLYSLAMTARGPQAQKRAN